VLPAVLSALAATGLGPVIAQIREAFAGEPDASFLVRFLLTAIGLSMIVGAPLAAGLARRFGRRRVMVAAALAYGVFGCAGFWLGSLPLIAASRVGLGLSMAVLGTLITTTITLHFADPARHRWLGFYSMTGTLSVFAILPLAGWLGASGWRAPFLLHAAAFPLALLLALALPKDPAPAAAAQGAGARGGGLSLAFVLFALIAGGVASGSPLFVPFHTAEIGVRAPRLIALAMLAQVAGAAVTAFLFGRIRGRVGQRATFLLAFGVSAVGLLGAAVPSYPAMLAALAFSGLGNGLITPNLFAMAATAGGEASRARNLGIVYAAFFAGPFAAQLLLEPFVQRSSAAAGLAGLAAMAGALMLVQALDAPLLKKPDPAAA
jgi:MFS family permease